jgi:hypothetical protein
MKERKEKKDNKGTILNRETNERKKVMKERKHEIKENL